MYIVSVEREGVEVCKDWNLTKEEAERVYKMCTQDPDYEDCDIYMFKLMKVSYKYAD